MNTGIPNMNIAVPQRSPKSYPYWVLVAPLLLLLAGCQSTGSGAEGDVLARVGNETLTEGEIRILYPNLLDGSGEPNRLDRVIERWIEQTLIRQEAEQTPLLQDSGFLVRLEHVRNRFVADEYLQTLIRSSEEEWSVSDQEARDYFQAHRDQFELEEPYVRFRHVTAETRREAVEARQELMNGRPWEEVARTYSTSPEERIELSESVIPRSRALRGHETLQQLLDVIGITEISPIQLSQGQYHFIQLMEERAAGESPDMEWLIEEIKIWLAREKARRHINSYKRNLYLQAESDGILEKFERP